MGSFLFLGRFWKYFSTEDGYFSLKNMESPIQRKKKGGQFGIS